MLVALVNAVGFLLLVVVAVGLLRWANTGRPPRVVRGVVTRVEAALEARRPKPEPLPPVLLAMELRRLAEDLRRIESTEQFAKAERMRSCTLAYDYVLREYCRSVEIPEPGGVAGLSPSQRFAMESALIGAGHEL